MKRKASLLLALALCLALTGCTSRPSSSQPRAESAETGEAASETAAPAPAGTPAQADTAQETASPEPPATMPDPTPAPEKNGMYDLLADIFDNYHFGIAGSTLTGARYAASLVEWGVSSGPDAVRAGAAAWDRGLENEFGESLEEKLTGLYAMALSFYGEGTRILDDCGWTGEWNHSGADIHAVFRQIYPGLGLDTPLVLRAYYPDSEVMHLRACGLQIMPEESGDMLSALNAVMRGVLEGENPILSAELDGTVLRLDLTGDAAAQIRAYGTSGELLAVQGIVNTALEYVTGADSVMLTVNGGTLETGHNIYDYPMTFTEE